MIVRRLMPGDENIACSVINTVKPEAERGGNSPDAAFMMRFLSTPTNYTVAACDGDVPLGYALAYLLPRVDRCKNMLYLHEVGVDEHARGTGVGKAMINEALRICREEGIMEMFVIADADNEPAKRLYSTTGGKSDPRTGQVVFCYDIPQQEAP